MKRMLSALFVFCLLTESFAKAEQCSISLSDAHGEALPNATVHILPVVSGQFAKPVSLTTDAQGRISKELEVGRYVLVSKHYLIDGSLNERFDAKFFPIASCITIEKGKPNAFAIQTATLTLDNAVISPQNLFANYQEDKLKTARLALVEEPSSRIIDLKGVDRCMLELKFPKASIGARGMHTYIKAAFMGFGDETMETDTYYYNGDVQWNHDVNMLGMRILPDGKNRLVIKDVKKKSGVEIPFEPFMSTLADGVVTNTYAHIAFVSSEKNGGPAQVVMIYRYIDDPGTVNNIHAVVPGITKP